MFCSLPAYCQTFFKAIASAKASETAAAEAPVWTIYIVSSSKNCQNCILICCLISYFMLTLFFLSAWEEQTQSPSLYYVYIYIYINVFMCIYIYIYKWLRIWFYIRYCISIRIFGLCLTAPRLCNPYSIFILGESLSPFLFRTFVWRCFSCDNVCHSLATCASMRREDFHMCSASPQFEMSKTKCWILPRNRAPTLHRLSLQACAVRKAEPSYDQKVYVRDIYIYIYVLEIDIPFWGNRVLEIAHVLKWMALRGSFI